MCDPGFIESQLGGLIDKSIYDFCVKDVNMKLTQLETSRKKKLAEIVDIEKQLLGQFTTRREKRHKYRITNKLARLKKSLKKDITFGGKNLLRDITKLSQIKEKTEVQNELLSSKKNLFTNNRSLGIYLLGRAYEKGNRKVNFDLENNKITFKPNKNSHIEIEFETRESKKLLLKLQRMSEERAIPLTIRLTSNFIHLTYDNELVAGYSFNDVACKKEQRLIDKENKEERKQVYIKHKREQESRKKIGKIDNRYISVDLNPGCIGVSVFDDCDGKQRFIHNELIDLSKLNTRLGLSSIDPKQIKQNNKRKHEIREAWKYIFKLATHFMAYNFVMEDLNFKPNKKDKGKGFNRVTKNLWHRTLTTELITKYCETLGLSKIEVNPCYSSFIGNMTNTFPDAVSAAVEIGRRGIFKYKKGSGLYPETSSINQEKLNYLLGENVDVTGKSWKQLYDMTSLLRYRNPATAGLKDNYLCSNKSRISRLIC